MNPAFIPLIGEGIRRVLDNLFPDPQQRAEAELKLRELEREGTFEQKAAQSIALAQIDLNKAEAQAQGWWKGGWRPGGGWVCVVGLGVHFIVAPLLPWVVMVASGKTVPPIPALDIETLLVLLGGLLGLGKLRSDERKVGKV